MIIVAWATISGRSIAADCDENGVDDSLEMVDHIALEWTVEGPKGVSGTYGTGLAVLDLTGDEIPDVIVGPGVQSGAAILLEGVGDGAMLEPRTLEGIGMRRPRAVDLDADGHMDLIFQTAGGLRVAWNAQELTLGGPPNLEAEIGVDFTGGDFEIVDFDGDGVLDIAVAEAQTRSNSIFRHDGKQQFTQIAGPELPSAGIQSSGMELEFGDFDGDGAIDWAIHLLFYFGHGEFGREIFVGGRVSGSFDFCYGYSEGEIFRAVDLDLDGRDELVDTSTCDGPVILDGFRQPTPENGGFRVLQPLAADRRGDVTAADFDADGRPDLAITSGRRVSVFYGDGSGRVHPGSTLTHARPTAERVGTAADLDGDGKPELVVVGWERSSPIVVSALSPRRGGDPNDNGVLDICEGTFFRRGDANADGRVDISDSLTILGYLFLGSGEPPCLDSADTDDSGSLDLTDGHLVNVYLFLGGFAMPRPGPMACLGDPTPDELDCRSSNCE